MMPVDRVAISYMQGVGGTKVVGSSWGHATYIVSPRWQAFRLGKLVLCRAVL